MSSNLPEGSMNGSGIDAEQFDDTVDCDQCDKTVDVVFTTNDWHTMAWAECPECGNSFERELNDESEHDDERYDAYQDELAYQEYLND